MGLKQLDMLEWNVIFTSWKLELAFVWRKLFHVGKEERKKKKKPAYLKLDPGIPAILWPVNIFILSPPSRLPIFFPFYVSLMIPFRLQCIARHISEDHGFHSYQMRPVSELLCNIQKSTELKLQRDLFENGKPEEMEHSTDI